MLARQMSLLLDVTNFEFGISEFVLTGSTPKNDGLFRNFDSQQVICRLAFTVTELLLEKRKSSMRSCNFGSQQVNFPGFQFVSSEIK